MKLARFWARAEAPAETSRGQRFSLGAWGWSADSQDEAASRAVERARRAAERFQSARARSDDYEYTDRPPREEIVQEIPGQEGGVAAAVTRNGYGALVLNTSDLMFIDVDVPEERSSLTVRLLSLLLGRKPEAPEARVRAHITRVASENRSYTFRLYRTRAGFRCAVADRPVPPDHPESERLLDAFGADPLYRRLCRSQGSYRARLTPKPWRCGIRKPPARFPFGTPEEEARYRAWEEAYEAQAGAYATCRFVEQLGTSQPSREYEALIDLHDRITRAGSSLDLA